MKHHLFVLICVLQLLSASSVQAQILRSDIGLSDPFIMADTKSQKYYMTGTGGGLWSSSDLETWDYLGFPLQFNNSGWMGMSPQVWASEIHYIDGKYYNMSTFTNGDIDVNGTMQPRRAVHIMSSSLPQGKYTLISGSDAIYLPAEKTTLDGTYFEDTDGKRYLLYCHEWVQNGNGTIEYIELKPDMTGTIGQGTIMTRAHDATWNTSPVTDGPYLFRTQEGRLGMIWTSWHGERYVQGVAYSTSGELSGPWVHEPLPITPDNYGHGMLFRTFDNKLLMSIHSHRNINLDAQYFERHPVLFVMDDSGDQLRTVMEYKEHISASNPSSVMVDNPEFEYGKLGWTCNTGAQNQLIANNQSGAITGNFFESWDASSYVGEIYQEKQVPNGTYQLMAAAFRSQLITGGKQDAEAVYLFANDERVLVDDTTPQNYTVTVHVTDGKLRFGITSVKKNFRWMGIDNVHVNYFGEELLSASEIEDAMSHKYVYLRNMRDGKYLNGGQAWGTQAILSNHPLDVRFVPLSNGKYAIDSKLDNGGGGHYASSNGYLDGAVTPFTVNWLDDHTITFGTDATHYWGSTGAATASTTLTAGNKGAKWHVLTRADLLNEMSVATPEEPVDATFLIECPNFGRNDTRVKAWEISSNCTNSNLSGGNNDNNCAESYHSPFTINQTLKDAPAGTYVLTAQGFYRQDEGKTEMAPKFFLGTKTSELAKKTGNESSMSDASVSFFANKYKSQEIVFYYNGQGGLQLGIKSTAKSQWVVWDNFQLSYLGQENVTAIDEVHEVSVQDNLTYNLQGQRISLPKRNQLYIRNHKKFLSR